MILSDHYRKQQSHLMNILSVEVSFAHIPVTFLVFVRFSLCKIYRVNVFALLLLNSKVSSLEFSINILLRGDTIKNGILGQLPFKLRNKSLK